MTEHRQMSSKPRWLARLVVGIAVVALAMMLLNRLNTNDPTVESVAFTSAVPDAAPAVSVVPTTAPIERPAAVATLATQQASTEDERATALLTTSQPNDSSVAESDPALDESATEEPDPSDLGDALVEPVASEPALAESSSVVANPQPAATEVPNPQPAATAVPNPQPAATEVPNPQPATTAVPNPQPSTEVAAVGAVPADAPAGGTFTHTLTATVSRPSLHTAPGGPTFTPTFNGTALPAVNPTVFGNALVYRVVAGTPGDAWAKVYVPARPNGTTAWVQTSQFNWGSSNRMLQINASDNTVTVFEGTNVLLTTSAVLGKSSSPTPIANGWVEEVMAGPSAAYGTKLISLGMFSDALNSFGGGVPKIALHGTNAPQLMGQYASNGCIRVRNEIIDQIASMLPIGSKVTIVR